MQALFGPVPKLFGHAIIQQLKENMISVELTDPILIQYKNKNYLIDASFNTSKLSDKQRRNLGILSESRIEEGLELF